MAVPDFQSIMLPLLQLASDGQEHILSETHEALADYFGLTEADRKELLPSGRQTKFVNRISWAKVYLTIAGLFQSTERGRFCITNRGLDVLQTCPPEINMHFLKQFPEYVEWRRGRQSQKNDEIEAYESEQTPQEILEASYQSLRRALAQELLDRIKACSPRFFESIVVDLLVAMGYGGSRKDAGQAVGQSGDGGIDGIIKEDKLGLDVVYIQAKRWEGSVGRPIVQGFAGSLEGLRARKGVFITTSRFTEDALEYVTRIEKKIVLIDGEELAQLMLDYGVGVTEVARYTVQRIDTDYFGDE